MYESNVHLKYRPDVDGLRAVAVLAVFVFHLFPKLLPGGFVGVDVFFVISGYLISGIILRSLNAGSFSFADFYIKRANRIFPSLVLVLCACFLAGWYYLLQDEFENLGKHIHKATVFFSNITFYKEAGYFDHAAELKPLLHLWSLGIEEQFYLIWPLLLFVAWKKSRQIGVLILGCLAASFLLNIFTVKRDLSGAFYLPQYRFWELLIGASLAYSETFNTFKTFKFSKFFNAELRSVLGMGLVLWSIAAYHAAMYFPGYWAVAPTLGAVLLISAGAEAKINRYFLAQRWMVFIGLISYPLYLWHWPVFSFARILEGGEPNLKVKTGLAMLSFSLAYLTYRFLEVPLKTQSKALRLRYAYSLSAVMVVVSVVGILARKETFVVRNNSGQLQKIMAAFYDWDYPNARSVPSVIAPDVIAYTRGTGPEKVLFMGDSNMEQFYPRVDHYFEVNPQTKHSAIFITQGGCIPIPEAVNHNYPRCPQIISAAKEYAAHADVKSVVLGAVWSLYFQTKEFTKLPNGDSPVDIAKGSAGYDLALKALTRDIQYYKSLGKKVFVVLNIPMGHEFNPRSMIKRSFPSGQFEINIENFDKAKFDAGWYPIREDIKNISVQAGATLLDPLDTFCTPEKCPTVDEEGKPVYKDNYHVRPFYVIQKASFLDQVFL